VHAEPLAECVITPFTGDNPSTILALPLRPLDVIVSLGTSTTLLMATPTYHPSVEYHLFNHPTTPGLYMFMLCYCNGSLARERVRDEVNKATTAAPLVDSWDVFNKTATTTQVGGKTSANDESKIGIYFPLPENIPNVQAGTWRFKYKDGKLTETAEGWDVPKDDVRAILESQALSMRMRASPLLLPDPKINDNKQQPRRIYVVGGASRNQAIAEAMGDVLGGYEGVYRLDIGGNACGLGAAYYAAWALEKKQGERFEDFVSLRWNEEGRVSKIASGYQKGVFEKYGELMKGFEMAEKKIIETAHN
jgi:xylulokinase